MLDYFESHLSQDGSYDEQVEDLACYYKSPMMFILANKPDKAKQLLTYVQSHYLTSEGDLQTSDTAKSIKPEYIEFWSYMNGWIIRAAQKLKQQAMSDPAYQYLARFNCGKDRGFLTHHPDANDHITDVLTAAHHGLINLERDNLALAKSAGNYLCEVVKKQPD